MQENKFYVYCLIDPRNGNTFYIGKGQGYRIKQHISDARTGTCRNKHLERKILQIISSGGKVVHKKILENVSEKFALSSEVNIIKIYRDSGVNLCNLTTGGEGVSGRHHTDDVKRILSIKSRGNKNMLGYKHTDESRKKISDGNMGKVLSPKTREAMRLAQIKKWSNPEYREMMVSAQRSGHEKKKQDKLNQ